MVTSCARRGGEPDEQARPTLQAALLQVDDLPGQGWRKTTIEAATPQNECGRAIGMPLGDPIVGATYTKGESREQLAVSVGEFASAREAARAMARVGQATACPPWTERIGGADASIRVSRSAGPVLGSESVSYRTTTKFAQKGRPPGPFADANTVTIRRNAVISTVTHFVVALDTEPRIDNSLIGEVAKRADEKLVAAGF